MLGWVGTASAQTTWGFTELDLLPLGGVTAPVRFFDLSGHAFTIQAPTAVTSYACTWPAAIGSANQTLSISTVSPCALAWTSSGAGNVTHTGTLTANSFIIGNGGADITALALTGLVLGHGASAPTAYAGTTPCSAGDFIQSLNGNGVATCATPAGGGNVNAAGTLTLHAIVLGQGTTSVATLGSLGTTTTVLHGNAAGDPSFSAVSLSADVTGTLAYASLPSQADSTVLSNISGGSATPLANSVTSVLDHAFGNTQGNILYRNATVWTVLAPGTSGQFLQTQGAAANPIWANQAGGTITGSGTTNLLTIWTGTTTVGALTNGSGVLHAGTPPTWSLVNLSAGGDVVNVLTVPNGGTGLSSGTTGGIPYFTSPTTIASSAALTNHAVVTGGGSAQAPHTIVTGTSGQFLQSQGAGADPIWAAAAGLGTAATGNLTYWSSATTVAGDATILDASAFGFATGASGATNRSALQAAHDALPATGGTVICPAGAYAITGTVTITKAVTWSGPCALTEATSSATIFAVQTTAGNVFDGLTLTNATSGAAITLNGAIGAAAWNSGTTYNAGDMVVSAGIPYTAINTNTNKVPASNPSNWFINSNSGTIIRNVTFVAGAYGVQTIRAAPWFIGPNNSFFSQTITPIFVTNTGNQDGGDSTIFSNFILPAPGADGIAWEGSGGTRIANNKIFAASSASPCAASIVIQPAADTATQAVQVVGNNLSNCNYGVLTQVIGGGSLTRLLISDNIIDGVLNAVNLSNSSVVEIIVSNNIMATAHAQTLINVALASDVTIVGNQLRGFGVSNTYGIDIAATTARIMVGPNNYSQLTAPARDSGTDTLYQGGGVLFTLAALPSTARVGSNVYCSDCRGSQDTGYAVGACTTTGTHTGAHATFQNGSWQC